MITFRDRESNDDRETLDPIDLLNETGVDSREAGFELMTGCRLVRGRGTGVPDPEASDDGSVVDVVVIEESFCSSSSDPKGLRDWL